MSEANEETPKIIVDSDWKEEARKEKEEADRETREMPEAGQIPEASFAELIHMIVLQATIGLGGIQDPQTGQPVPPNLPVAKHYIDLLELFHTKTANNLDEQENEMLSKTLHDLHMAFVQIAGVKPEEPKKE